MSLRPPHEQSAYEEWRFAELEKARAEGRPSPDDAAARWAGMRTARQSLAQDREAPNVQN